MRQFFQSSRGENSYFLALSFHDDVLDMLTKDGAERHRIIWSGDEYFDQLNDQPVWARNGTLDSGEHVQLIWEHLQDDEDASNCADWDNPVWLVLDAERFYATRFPQEVCVVGAVRSNSLDGTRADRWFCTLAEYEDWLIAEGYMPNSHIACYEYDMPEHYKLDRAYDSGEKITALYVNNGKEIWLNEDGTLASCR